MYNDYHEISALVSKYFLDLYLQKTTVDPLSGHFLSAHIVPHASILVIIIMFNRFAP